jgi:ornithine carbamoyltransferase
LKKIQQELDVLLKLQQDDLGMGSTYLGPTGSQMGKKETIADTARVLSRMYDGIEFRGFSEQAS